MSSRLTPTDVQQAEHMDVPGSLEGARKKQKFCDEAPKFQGKKFQGQFAVPPLELKEFTFASGIIARQIYRTGQNGGVGQALSLDFLLCWIAGDLTNFTGCYLTNQLPSQIVTAIFFANVENILISQFVCYKLKNLKMTKCSDSLKSSWITWILVWVALCGVFLSQLVLKKQDQNRGTKRSNNSLDMIEMSGLICGSISSVFYLGSRFPQLYKNFQR